MSSRILRQTQAVQASPIAWPQRGTPTSGFGLRFPSPDEGRNSFAPATACADASSQPGLDPQWTAELERIRQESYRQGEAAGQQKAGAQLDALMRKLAQTIEDLSGYRPRLRGEIEREAVGLALAIARRVLRREIQVDRDAVLGLVKAAFEKASLREVTEVRIHPAHAPALRAHLDAIGAPQAIEIREDPSLEPGAIIVETARGGIDASLSAQLDEIGRGLADAHSGRLLP